VLRNVVGHHVILVTKPGVVFCRRVPSKALIGPSIVHAKREIETHP
jgi:hypothetical protein